MSEEGGKISREAKKKDVRHFCTCQRWSWDKMYNEQNQIHQVFSSCSAAIKLLLSTTLPHAPFYVCVGKWNNHCGQSNNPGCVGSEGSDKGNKLTVLGFITHKCPRLTYYQHWRYNQSSAPFLVNITHTEILFVHQSTFSYFKTDEHPTMLASC